MDIFKTPQSKKVDDKTVDGKTVDDNKINVDVDKAVDGKTVDDSKFDLHKDKIVQRKFSTPKLSKINLQIEFWNIFYTTLA